MFMPSIWGENLFDEFFNDFRAPIRKPVLAGNTASALMKTDVVDKEDAFELHVELPGFKKENVKAELKDGYMTISANNADEKDEKDDKGQFIRRERFYGSCSRSFYVGDNLTEEDIKAKFEDGVLKLTVPKKEAKPQVEENHYIAIEG